MQSLRCPNCGTEMQKKNDPDITTDVCPECHGVWLDEGELNVLASGMAGDIEFNSIDKHVPKDQFPARQCPKCSNQSLLKENILRYSEVIIDHCPNCNGFFLDSGETSRMNAYLASISEDGMADEFRGYIDDYLVKVKRLDDVRIGSRTGLGLITTANEVSEIRISVYFVKPLDLGLRVYSSKWGHRLLKRLGLFRKQDIETGDQDLDSAFIIQGDHEDRIKTLFSGSEIRDELLNFYSNSISIYGLPGSLEITDERAIYTEGPYKGLVAYDPKADSYGIVAGLTRLVKLVEGST